MPHALTLAWSCVYTKVTEMLLMRILYYLPNMSIVFWISSISGHHVIMNYPLAFWIKPICFSYVKINNADEYSNVLCLCSLLLILTVMNYEEISHIAVSLILPWLWHNYLLTEPDCPAFSNSCISVAYFPVLHFLPLHIGPTQLCVKFPAWRTCSSRQCTRSLQTKQFK